jgi:serine protein kinase
MDLASYLDHIQTDQQDRFQRSDRVLAFNGFLEEFFENPFRHLRTAPQYLLEMFDHFGRREGSMIGQETCDKFRLFDLEVQPGLGGLVGQERIQNEIYRYLLSFAKRGKADKMLLLHGPNGSGKTTVIECIIRGLEQFSRTPEGTLLTFNWVFTEREGKLDRIGFETESDDISNLESYAHLDEKDVSAKLGCELRDPPLFLIPTELRAGLIEQATRGTRPSAYPGFSYDFFLEGDLCQKCKKIYDSLLVAYQGDWKKVIRHVQVERFYLSKRYRVGAVSIEPQGNVDAGTRPIHSEHSWNVPAVLRNVSLFQPVGDIIDGNRGILEYSDFLKRPLEVNKYLLTTCERGTVNLGSCMAYLDLMIFGTANEKQLSVFKRSPDFSSFKGRIELIPAPYLLKFSTEVELYRRQIRSYSRDRHITPHAAKIGALWAVLARLRKPNPKHFQGALRSAVENLTPIEKAKLYDTGELPDGLSEEEKKALRAGIVQIRQEFDEDEGEFEGVFGAEYEGRRGVSPREMMTVFSRAAGNRTYRCLTPMAVFEALEELLKDVSLYDFLRLPLEDDYHDVRGLLQDVRREYFKWVTEEVYDSINLIDEAEYDRVFLEYFRHVKAFDSKEKVYNAASNSYEPPNLEMMASIEKLVGLSEPREVFRSHIMTRIAAWSLDHRQEKIDYHRLFPEIYKALRDNFYRERNRILTLIEKDIIKYGTDEFALLSPAEREQVRTALATMRTKYRYCDECARDVIAYVLKYRMEMED